MRTGRYATLLAVLATVAPASAGVVCDTLGGLARWNVATARRFVTRARHDATGPVGARIDGAVCTARATLQATQLSAPGAGLVATRRSGVGVRFLDARSADSPALVNGDVLTGGADVEGALDDVNGTVDTSGDHPEVAACAKAIAGMTPASAALAALPTTRDLGDVIVHAQGPPVTIDARGGGVFPIRHLTLQDESLVHDATGTLTCPGGAGGRLTILANPGDQVVLNVYRLWIGQCSTLIAPAGDVVLNVYGVGRAVRIAAEASLPDVAILAPDRDVELGGGWTAGGTVLGPFWSRRAILSGASIVHATRLACP